jgi:hypothetical protein
MSVDVLGKPWIRPKKVNSSGGKTGEDCPGQPSIDKLAPPVVSVGAAFTEGKQRGASIASFTVSTLPSDGPARYRSAWLRTLKSCASFKDASGLYVVTRAEGPDTVAGTTEVLSRVERVYYDAPHKHLAYARHILVARTGRFQNRVEYDFLTTRADPNAKDFAPAQKLLARQLAKTKAVLAP